MISFRKVLFWLHLAAGCLAGIVILVMSVTGVLLAYQRQIVAWEDSALRSTAPVPGAHRLQLDAMLQTVFAKNENPPSAITLRADPNAPAEVGFGRDAVILVDVYSGRVLGDSSRRTRAFFQAVEDWHRWLGASMAQRAGGRAITGACNLAFLGLVVSGPFLWLPRKWTWKNVKAVLFFRRGLSGKARDFNWHNVIGIWCMLPLFVIVLSGVVMSYPWANNLVFRLAGSEPPLNNNQRPGNEGGGRRGGHDGGMGAPQAATLNGLDRLWTRAEQQVAGWQTITLRLPRGGHGPFTFTIDTGAGGRPDQKSQLTLDRQTGGVLRWEPFSSYNAGRQSRSWLRFLHTGEAGGVLGESVAAIASAGAAALVWTGLWLTGRRCWRWRARRSETRTATDKVSFAAKA